MQPTAPPTSSATAPKRSGCARFLRCGCFSFLSLVVLLLAWQFFPTFRAPKTSRYALCPDTAVHVMSSRDPAHLGLAQQFYFPIREVPKWLATAGLKQQDIAQLAIINTAHSAALLLELRKPAAEVFATLRGHLNRPGRIENFETVEFPTPDPKSGPLPWCWAMPNATSLVIGHPIAVHEILLTASGQRPGIRSRTVLKELLSDFEDDESFDLKLVPESQEATMVVAQAAVTNFSQVPGAGLLVGGRGMGISLGRQPDGCVVKIDFQYRGRASALFVANIFRVFRLFGGPGLFADPKKRPPKDLIVKREGGLVGLHTYFDAAQCAETSTEGLFPLFPTPEMPALPRHHRKSQFKKH
jgi:hypothetical protein